MLDTLEKKKLKFDDERDEFDELLDEINKNEQTSISNEDIGKQIDKLIKDTSLPDYEIKIQKQEIDTNVVENVFNLFTVDKGIIKVLLVRKQEEPYKGYWILPSSILKLKQDLDLNVNSIIKEQIGLDNLGYEQSTVFSNIDSKYSGNTLVISFIGIIKKDCFKDLRYNKSYEYEWFPIEDIPKIAYEYNKVILETSKSLSNLLNKSYNLKLIFPEEFALSELQTVYEKLLNKTFDRRNFRKKFIQFDLIEETGKKNELTNGRPAKLYRFKDRIEDINLF